MREIEMVAPPTPSPRSRSPRCQTSPLPRSREHANKRLVLVAMIFAVAMMFIDQTIVALAIPDLQKDLSLSSTGAQWIVNGYLLSLAALFVLGGKLSDVLGHRRMVVIGVTGFAVCSALCGATPTGEHRRDLDDRVPRPAGRVRRAHVPRRAGDRRLRLPAGRARSRARRLLRHHGRAHRGRPARRRLPHRVDLARDLLDQHPRRDHRADPDRQGQAGRDAPARADRLPRRRPDLRRHGPRGPRPPAGRRLGLDGPEDDRSDRRRHRAARAVRRLRAARAGAARSASGCSRTAGSSSTTPSCC